jgi:hypothetical protein
MSIVSIELARSHLEVIGTSQDAKIQQYLSAAEAYAEQYMNRPLQPWEITSQSSEVPVPPDVVQAILLILADFFENREAGGSQPYNRNPAAEALMHFHRKGLGV